MLLSRKKDNKRTKYTPPGVASRGRQPKVTHPKPKNGIRIGKPIRPS